MKKRFTNNPKIGLTPFHSENDAESRQSYFETLSTLIEIIIVGFMIGLIGAIIFSAISKEWSTKTDVSVTVTQGGEKGALLKLITTDYASGVYVVEYEGEVYLVNNQGGDCPSSKGGKNR